MSRIYRTRAELKVSPLAFTENCTLLRKVIANSLNIIASLIRKIGWTGLLIAITLLNSSSSFRVIDYRSIKTIGSKRSVDSKVDVIVIDAGHGGHDNGTHGKVLKEKDLALKIALKVGSYIEKNVPGVKVIYTRKDDTYIALDERAAPSGEPGNDRYDC